MRRYNSIVRRSERSRAPVGRERSDGCCAIWKRAGHWDVAAGKIDAQRPKQYSTRRRFCAKPQSEGGKATFQKRGAGATNSMAASVFPSFMVPLCTTRQATSSPELRLAIDRVWPGDTLVASWISAPCALTTRVMVASENGVRCGVSPITIIGTRRRTRKLRRCSFNLGG
jgi:hypothetical protein